VYGVNLVILQFQHPEGFQEMKGSLRHGADPVVAEIQMLQICEWS
jgi:hypothetical protein